MEAANFIPLDWREWRRSRAVILKRQGWYQRDLGEALGVSGETVSRWLVRARSGGPAALRTRPSSGRPPKLSATEKRLIPEFLWHGPEAYGFRGRVRTCARVARVIEEEFGVRSHQGHVRKAAQLVGVSTRQIGQWLRIFRNQGLEQLCTLHYKGDPGQLRPAQIQQLKHQIAQGGFHNTEQVRTWIDQTFGIRIHGQRPLVSTLRFGAVCKEAFRTECELAVELLREQARVLGELHLGVFDGVSPPEAVDSI